MKHGVEAKSYDDVSILDDYQGPHIPSPPSVG